MKIRKGVCAIIFFDSPKKTEYLILKRKLNWKGWEFLKGGIKGKESELAALKREIKEEIGVKKFGALKTKEFNFFKYQKEYIKDKHMFDGAKNTIFLVQIFSKKIKIDRNEHSGFRWVDRKTVLKMLTWKDSRKIFEKLTK